MKNKAFVCGALCSVIIVSAILIAELVFKSPILAFGKKNTANESVTSLQKNITHIIEEAIANEDIESSSVYVKDLSTKDEISVHIKFKYTPASLLKVPLAMSIYKVAESDPSFLQRKVVYHPDQAEESISQYFVPDHVLTVGTEYTIEDLVSRMLMYSDNRSMRLLLAQIDEQSFIDVYKKLNVYYPEDSGTNENYMGAKDYAQFFESLYAATYLNKENSDKLLDILSQSTFNKGLRSGLPHAVRVTHKFGERRVADSNITQLHDCGIIYTAHSPYSICVMVKGEDFSDEESTIGEISTAVYSYMSQK